VEGAVSTDTTLTWQPVRGANDYVVRWRRTDANNWENSVRLMGPCVILATNPPVEGGCSHVLRGVRVDDYVFGVSSLSERGFESPVASAVPGGAFAPYTPPPPAQ
jgi:hypothetical protein